MAGFDEAAYERSCPREPVRSKVELSIDAQRHDCVITNISPAGARLYVRLNAVRGQVALIRIGDFGEFGATVAWCYGDEVGLKFDHDPAEMTLALKGLAW